ncbi:hypothetical protein BBO99_00001884 [Phytophthora kernoviae]|uniref:Uncharacterized protein n=2 Tax=Phytophthora kernoviae TaxID=325452 RepID=A0A3R7KXG0_9STRA|nr:hypothetical protein G195_001161 [Phytophthora kernoviae 00238/432]KAG2529222.1 hypothetical protein JM18_001742 [Phytophthora kernoviae]KAG2530002.1 hypothetical protein JM16_001686 [Phytophthora kernoviae]RLN26988.1 hypothetical protein BBI17_001741 [Phytophthora kernoviae]RLN83665.1 hypothetical protein BBO99_00001884 [Phytophthora kernoviae]
MATRARKRQFTHRQRPRGFSLDDEEDEHLVHMDPSLMTERQQLAFLLRTTAHEASDVSRPSDESSEDEDTAISPRPTKKARRIHNSSIEVPPTRRGPGPYEASFSDALFLCPSCDRKYPTQQTLDRMCMT